MKFNQYLHFLAKGGTWSKENLTLFICSICHPWQLWRNNHRVEALGTCLQQAVTGLWPGNIPLLKKWWTEACYSLTQNMHFLQRRNCRFLDELSSFFLKLNGSTLQKVLYENNNKPNTKSITFKDSENSLGCTPNSTATYCISFLIQTECTGNPKKSEYLWVLCRSPLLDGTIS